MKILALDLGTETGYAYGEHSQPPVCGTLELATKREVTEWGKSRLSRRCDPRIWRLQAFVHDLCRKFEFDVLIFEDVNFSSYTYQVQLWASLRAAAWIGSTRVPHSRVVHYDCVPVKTLKLFAAGHGAATKDMMLAAAKRKKLLDNFAGLDDNAIDALHLFDWARINLARMDNTNEK